MDDIINHFTKVLKSVLDALFMDRPERTALGALLGIGIFIIGKLVSLFFGSVDYIGDSGLSEMHFILLGVFLIYMPTIIRTMFSASEFSEDVEAGFRLIKRARQDGIPEWQTNQMYLKLCETALKNTNIKPDLQQDQVEK